MVRKVSGLMYFIIHALLHAHTHIHTHTHTHTHTVNPPVQSRVLRQEHIILGTSGKVLDWMKKGVIDPNLVSKLVVCGADIVINQQGGHDQTMRILK